MTVQSIHHMNLRIAHSELRTVRDFYCEVLGLTEGWRPPFASNGYWLYANDAPIVHLVAMSPDEQPRARPGGAIDHVSLRCVDLDGTLDQLRARDIEFSISEVPLLGDTQVFFKDPVGVGVELTFEKARDNVVD